MKRIFGCALVALSAAAGAVERRDLGSVPLAELVAETQQMRQTAEGLALVWWVPVEFWTVAILQNEPHNTAAVQEFQQAFAEYLLVGVVEGKHKILGGLEFSPRESVLSRLRAQVGAVEYAPVERPRKEAQLVTEMMKPMLHSMLGELGTHFHLILLATEKGTLPSPYEPGTLRVTLAAAQGGGETRSFEFSAPLDSLHVPRQCPNGRAAHISWKFCPWDGTRLAD